MEKSVRVIILLFISAFVSFSIVLAESNNAIRSATIKDTEGNEVVLYNESHALVIGASDYRSGWAKLSGVNKDVKNATSILKKHGFNVVVTKDPSYEGLNKAFTDFINRYGHKQENRLLFYYAGHGYTTTLAYGDDMGYIVPVDAPNPHIDREGFLEKALDMQQIEVYAKRIQSKHAIFLFDSCFSGSIFTLSRSVPEIITYKTAEPVRQFITAGSAKEKVPDESVFNRQFIAALNGEGDVNNDGYVTGTELGEFLQTKVVNYTKGAQHPQYGKIRNQNLDKGDFVFIVGSRDGLLSGMKPASKNKTDVATNNSIQSSAKKHRVTGMGVEPNNSDMSKPQRIAMAYRAAELDARRKLLESVQGVKIGSNSTDENFIAKNDQIDEKVNGFLKGAYIVDKRVTPDGLYEVDMEIELTP